MPEPKSRRRIPAPFFPEAKGMERKLRGMRPLAEGKARSFPQFDLEAGIREVVGRVGRMHGKHTLLIAVYGHPNAGKTYLIKRLAKEFEALGMLGSGGVLGASCFERIKDDEASGYYSLKRVVAFHCAWTLYASTRRQKIGYEKASGHEDPNVLAEKILNRKVDLNIFIDKKHPPKASKNYDLGIINPDAVVKPPISF
jgi:hypothetical protein